MKWTKQTAVIVIAILSLSYIYTSYNTNKLSDEIKKDRWDRCTDKGHEHCDLILKYHDECFTRANQAQYRVRTFRSAEYNKCIEKNIERYILSEFTK